MKIVTRSSHIMGNYGTIRRALRLDRSVAAQGY